MKFVLRHGSLILAFLTLLALRGLPLLQAPLGLYGYDYGFYRYAIFFPRALNLKELVLGQWQNYDNLFFSLVHFLHLPPEQSLTISYVIVALGIAGVLSYSLGHKNYSAAVISVCLFALSVIQNESWLQFFWKGALASVFLLLFFTALSEKRYWLSSIGVLGILLVHQKTALALLIIVSGSSVLLEQLRKKRFWLIGSELSLLIFGVVISKQVWLPVVHAFINQPNQTVVSGSFLLDPNLLWLSLPLLALGVLSLLRERLVTKNSYILLLYLVSAVWILLRLPLFHRLFIYLDLGGIYFAALYLSGMAQRKRWEQILVYVLLGLSLMALGVFFKLRQPLLTQTEAAEIQTVTQSHGGSFVLATDSDDAPWLLGFSHGVRLAAPGLFEDQHSFEQWQDFWEGANQADFLKAYPRPLLLYQRTHPTLIDDTSCVKPVSEHFTEYSCD